LLYKHLGLHRGESVVAAPDVKLGPFHIIQPYLISTGHAQRRPPHPLAKPMDPPKVSGGIFPSETGRTKERRDLIEQFEADYNAVDRFLRGALDADGHIGFAKMVRRYADQHGGWADAELLITTAKIRSLIVHERTDLHRHVVIPTLAVAEGVQNGGVL
jgi:hypothetical protein